MADKKYYQYMYNMQLKMIFTDKSALTIDNINTIVKHFNYQSDFFPIYECDCVVPLMYNTKIRSNQDSIYVILTITKYKYLQYNTSDPESTEVILNHTFIPFFMQDSFKEYVDSNTELNAEGSGTSTGNGNPASSIVCHLRFAMYSIIGLNANKKLMNYVADECDVGTMLKLLINRTDVEECIIDKPDNEDTYKNLIITPHNLRGALRELQTRYGIYSNGLTEFYDPPTLYILNKFTLNHDKEDKKINNITINCYTVAPAIGTGITQVTEEKEHLTYNIAGFPRPINQDTAASEINGNEILFSNISLTTNMLDYEDGELKNADNPTASIDSDAVSHKKSGKKIVVDYDEINNPYNYSAMLKAANLGTLVVLPSIAGVDIDSIRPNTSIIINIKDDVTRAKEYNGNYSIVGGSITISKGRIDADASVCALNNLILSRMDSE